MQQLLELNTQETVHGAVIQETELVGDNAQGVDADIQCEPIRLMHNMPNPSVTALSGTPILMSNGEDPSVPMTRQATDTCAPLRGPASAVVAPIRQISLTAPTHDDRCLDADPTDICERFLWPYLPNIFERYTYSEIPNICGGCPHSKVSSTCERCHCPNSRTTVKDVLIFQVPANDTPGTKPLVDVPILKSGLRPPDPENAYGVVTRQSTGLLQGTLRREGCSEHSYKLFISFVLMLTNPP